MSNFAILKNSLIKNSGEMVLDRHIDKTEESLQMLDDSLPQASVDRFLYGLKLHNWDEEAIMAFTIKIRNSHSYALLENTRLTKWKATFNEEYATNHNKYFTTAESAMNRMRSTLKGITDAIIKFCYRSNKALPADVDAPMVLERTPLLKGPYSKDMFGTDLYGKTVMLLFEELISYLNTAEDNVTICLDVIARENYLREHIDEVNEVYDKCFEDTFRNNRSVIKRLKESNANLDNDILKTIEDAEDAQQMIADLFHMLNLEEWNDFVVCKAIHDANKAGLDKKELFLWGEERKEKVMLVRKLLGHLSDLDLSDQNMKIDKQEGVVSGEFLMRLLVWCDINENSSHSVWLEYVTDKILSAQECRFTKVAKIGAIKAERKKMAFVGNDEIKKLQNTFNMALDSFIDNF